VLGGTMPIWLLKQEERHTMQADAIMMKDVEIH
jgi:hypothetical protein